MSSLNPSINDSVSLSQLPTISDDQKVDQGTTGDNTPIHAFEPGPLQPIHTLPIEREDGKVILTEEYCIGKLGFDFKTRKKWAILTVIFLVQVSMNFNAGVYGNSIKGMQEEFHISPQASKTGMGVFLIAYGIGSELWAPWSEDIGRWPIMQASLFLVNIFQMMCALAPNYNTVIVARALGGLSSAGGSVTLGMIADMWGVDSQQYALNFMVLSSCSGSSFGPIFGAFLQKYANWRWVPWAQLIVGGVVQAVHFFVVPETRIASLIDKEAKRLRQQDPHCPHIYGPGEVSGRPGMKEVFATWGRPFQMFVKEPIVLWLSLLSGFSDALIFIFMDSFHPVFDQWGFGIIQHGLTFIPVVIGYVIAYVTYFPTLRKQEKIRRSNPELLSPETRLAWLCKTAPLLAIGLFGFAGCSYGPPVPWVVPMVFVCGIALANYNIYMGTVDYMVAAYGPYSASATGGNALARDVLAGVAAFYAGPFYSSIAAHPWKLVAPTLILGVLSVGFLVSLYVIYYRGETMRLNSKMAQDISHERQVVEQRRRTLNPDDIPDIEAAIRNTRRSGPPTRQPTPAPHDNEVTYGHGGHGASRPKTEETTCEVSEVPTST